MSKVYLVGGGPGDVNLLTLQGLHCIQMADCILYDNLIDPLILTYASETCECIYVGKKGHHTYMLQQEITTLLIEKAHQCACVVRLKGGDSYVFGRGGEEVLALREANIDVTVVPGVSSTIAGLAVAGIPITHRGLASGFQVMSAHTQNDQANFCAQDIANPAITTVFVMGVSKLALLIDKLREAKRDSNTPMAVISQACTPQQQILIATIDTMQSVYDAQPLPAPALIVVGDVVSLQAHLASTSALPLQGKRILISKLQHACSPLSVTLKKRGASIVECQVGKIIAHPFTCCLADIKATTWLLFTSQHAIQYFFSYFLEYFDIREIAHIRFVVIGKKCAKALTNYGIRADEVIQPSNRDALKLFLQQHLQAYDQLLYPKHYEQISVFKDESFVFRIKELCVYENQEVAIPELDAQDYDAICCSNASSVHRLMHKLHHPRNTLYVSIGKSTSSALASYQVPFIEAKETSYEAMHSVLEEELQHVSR